MTTYSDGTGTASVTHFYCGQANIGAAGPKGSNPQNRLVGNFATDHGQIRNLHALNLGNKRWKREKTLSVASSISLRNSIIFLRGSNCRSKRLQTLIIVIMTRSLNSTTLSPSLARFFCRVCCPLARSWISGREEGHGGR